MKEAIITLGLIEDLREQALTDNQIDGQLKMLGLG